MDYLEKLSSDIKNHNFAIVKDVKNFFDLNNENKYDLVLCPNIIIMKNDFIQLINEFAASNVFDPNCMFYFYKIQNNENCI